MDKYRIEVKLLTEAIFGSGYSIPGSVDLEIVYDEYGLPYMKGKTFKGNFRNEMFNAIKVLGEKKFGGLLVSLLGEENKGVESWKNLKFSDCRITKNIRDILVYGVKEKKLTPDEIKESLTEVRSFTSIDDDGSYKKGSLRQFRVIKKGLTFEVDIYCGRELSVEELGIMAVTAKMMRHIGTMRTRGKGEVECSFLVYQNGGYKDMTEYYIDSFIKGVRENA
ncbi:MAG: RAMP superfamily CRISPR-associated protein [Thermoanaerobacteraceae bacterium]|nr:RAMP superfamily CRISPR-associated protein [Thermoanaerobacteraceae bacterium]